MGAIIPAILPLTRDDLDGRLARLHGLTDDVQIDVVDGKFVRPASWPYAHGSSELGAHDALSELSSFKFEADLMVENPSEIIGSFVRAGATRITVHVETVHNLGQIVSEFQVTYGHDKGFAPDLLAFGLAINLATDPSIVEPYLDRIDYVQFMGIAQIGKQGEPFAPSVLPKIAAFHRKHPDMLIQVDGGVSHETAPKLLAAGAGRLVVGSDLWNAPDIASAFHTLEELTQVYGLYA